MEHDLVNVPKLVMLDFNKKFTKNGQNCYPLDPNNSSVINTLYIWNSSYAIDCFCPIGSYTLPTYTDTSYDRHGNLLSNGCSTPAPAKADIGKHNQFTLWSPALNKSSDKNKLPFSFTNFGLVFTDNNINDTQGNPAIIDSLAWHQEDEWADLNYRKNELYTKNLNATITLPTGQ